MLLATSGQLQSALAMIELVASPACFCASPTWIRIAAKTCRAFGEFVASVSAPPRSLWKWLRLPIPVGVSYATCVCLSLPPLEQHGPEVANT